METHTHQLVLQLHRETAAFHFDIDQTLTLQGITFLFGPSGSGKTTLLRSIAGLDILPGSHIQFNQEQWQHQRDIVPTHQRAIGYVFQEPSLFPHLTIQQNIEYGYCRHRATNNKITIQEVIDWLDLSALLTRRSHELSLGQKQRVAIARAVLGSPQLLLMDEPLASLDRQSKHDIMPYFETLQRQLNLPIIYVSHAMEEVLNLADQLVLMHQGQITASGPVNQIMTDPSLPLAQEEEAAAILQGEILQHDHHYALTQVQVPGGHLTVAQRNITPGNKIKIKLMAKDVSLALEKPQHSSISNALLAEVICLQDSTEPSLLIVQLGLKTLHGYEFILARITKRSRDLLKLEPGSQVYALVKSASIIK
ncbi:Spermidine/putrescine import ATP-binding protein PotA [Thalassocella blandensis]|nr:Spermidine/putrescine import ATP-binding protein PotA [Thalassocella blandensis]